MKTRKVYENTQNLCKNLKSKGPQRNVQGIGKCHFKLLPRCFWSTIRVYQISYVFICIHMYSYVLQLQIFSIGHFWLVKKWLQVFQTYRAPEKILTSPECSMLLLGRHQPQYQISSKLDEKHRIQKLSVLVGFGRSGWQVKKWSQVFQTHSVLFLIRYQPPYQISP